MQLLLPLEQPTIFPESIVAGVTLRAADLFPPRGFSVDVISTPSREGLLLAETLGATWEQLKFQRQVHGASVRWVQANSPIAESDGMVTAEPGLFLCVRIADCCAVLLASVDPPVVAALHAGWRGIAQGIVEEGLRALFSAGCFPSGIRVYLSPCASAERYVVRRDVAALFTESVERVDSEYYRLDLRKEIRRRLQLLGIPESQIESSPGCTIGDSRYHSFRRDGAAAGRMVAFIGMRSGASTSA
ncbi:MAG: polyphenol oxidase family protein [Chlorobiota bacterium]